MKNKKPIEIGYTQHLSSKILKCKIELNIRTPKNFPDGKRQYPIVYVLDGAMQFYHMTGTIEALERCYQIPEMIYIGFNLSDRWGLSTPSKLTDQQTIDDYGNPNSGNAHLLASFFEKELFPFAEKKLQASPFRILSGYSLTGLYTTWNFLYQQHLFSCYHASTPSLWWNKGELAKKMPLKINKSKGFKQIYIDVANESSNHVNHIKKFYKLLNNSAPKQIRHKLQQYKEEGHVSVSLPGFHAALRFFFYDWNIEFSINYPTKTQFKKHYDGLSKRYQFQAKASEIFLIQTAHYYLEVKNKSEAKKILLYTQEQYPHSNKAKELLKL
ncbi:MAG: hypothetical protein COA79_18995 [Planctomycetota bacterium]|nr:MAG: hypothetical protein COA79_18995 [Planctomycetota bacterium]